MVGAAVGDAIAGWAENEPSVKALVLIGSRARERGSAELQSDEFSDWDFHVVTSRPDALHTDAWLVAAGLPRPTAYALRLGRLGTANKVNAIVDGCMVDIVIIPIFRIRLLRLMLSARLVRRFPAMWHALLGLATVAKDGHQVLKGGPKWTAFYARVAREIPSLRLSNSAARAIADGFVYDYFSTRQKIARGELIAAQRWLHVHLAEANFQLLHELRQRSGLLSMPDGRRVERLVDSTTVSALAIDARLHRDELWRAVDHAGETLRELMRQLVGNAWRWPDI